MYKLAIDQVEIHPQDGSITVRFHKLFVDETGASVLLGYHRSSVMRPGDDVGKHIDEINNHAKAGIAGIKFAALPDTSKTEIQNIAKLVHTPERIAARLETDAKTVK